MVSYVSRYSSSLPVVLRYRDFHKETVYISQYICGEEMGRCHTLYTPCPTMATTTHRDDCIHPHYSYEQCNLSQNIRGEYPGSPTISTWDGHRGRNICGVVIDDRCLSHVEANHTFPSYHQANYQAMRGTWDYSRYNSHCKCVFIHPDIVLPLIKDTLFDPDNVTIKGATHYVQKLFHSEIGHGPRGCYYICTVVVKRAKRGHRAVTAYLVPSFFHRH